MFFFFFVLCLSNRLCFVGPTRSCIDELRLLAQDARFVLQHTAARSTITKLIYQRTGEPPEHILAL